jgi:hypothetical protein
MKRAVRAVWWLLIGACWACGSDNVVAPNPARLVISLPASVISVTRGNRIAVAAEVTREGGPASAMTISITAPTGVTASVASQSTTGSTMTAELAFTVSSSAATGRYTVVIVGHATGYPDATATLALDLNGP